MSSVARSGQNHSDWEMREDGHRLVLARLAPPPPLHAEPGRRGVAAPYTLGLACAQELSRDVGLRCDCCLEPRPRHHEQGPTAQTRGHGQAQSRIRVDAGRAESEEELCSVGQSVPLEVRVSPEGRAPSVPTRQGAPSGPGCWPHWAHRAAFSCPAH